MNIFDKSPPVKEIMQLEFTSLPKDVIAYIFAFIPKANVYSCLNKPIHRVLSTSPSFKRLWIERNIIQSKTLDLVWLGNRNYFSYVKNLMKAKEFCHRYMDEKYIIPYSGIYTDYYRGYLEETFIYENGKLIIKINRGDVVYFLNKEYKPYQRKCKCKYNWVKNNRGNSDLDEIIYIEAFPIRTNERSCGNEECKKHLNNEIRLKWIFDDSIQIPESYEICINSGKKRYRVYNQLNEEKVYKVKRKCIGKKIKCVKRDGTIIRRSRMQEMQTIETEVFDFHINIEIPKKELFSDILELYNISICKIENNQNGYFYLPEQIHEELLR